MNFNEIVWKLTRKIPKGKVTTYGEIAKKMKTKAFRAVGHALHVNPYSPNVPCHRVVGSTGHLTGFASGLRKKRRMLIEEGLQIKNNKILNFEENIFKF